MFNPIMKQHQINPDLETFHKVTAQHSSKCQGHDRQGKIIEFSQNGENLGDVIIRILDWILKEKNNISRKINES